MLASIAGGLLAFVAFWQEPESTTLTAIAAQSPAWPESAAPLRVVFLSDFHVDAAHMGASRIARIVAAVNMMAPDVVLLGGDYIGGPTFLSRARRSPAANARDDTALGALVNLHARYGVFAVIGNHDCWWDCVHMRALLERDGVKVLSNSAEEVRREDGSSFWIAGMADKQTEAPDFAAISRSVPRDAPLLLVMHNPKLFDASGDRFPIQFAGHTHGGQVRFPLLGAPLQISRTGGRFWPEGALSEGGRLLFISRGLGESGIPVRFGEPPEIMLVEIRHGPLAHARVN
jgi:predicted MPP superfamily phosphohydrolase